VRPHLALRLALVGLLAAPACIAAEPQDPAARLTKRERESVYNSIETCSSLETTIRQMNAEIENMVKVAAGRDEAVEYVIRVGLRHREAHARMAAVEALALIGNPKALPDLNELIEFDANYTVRRYAVRAVAGFGDRVALTALFRELPDFDGSLHERLQSHKRRAPKRYRQLGGTITRALNRYESLISRMAGNVDPDEQQKAKKELQRLTGDVNRDDPKDWQKWWKDRKGRPPGLHRSVNRTADRTTMMTLIEIAAMIDAREALQGLAAALRHGETSVKMAAAAALGRMGKNASRKEDRNFAAEALRGATRAPSAWVKAAAAAGLAECDAERSVADFKRLLGDWDPANTTVQHRSMLARVRRAAVKGLRLAGSDNAEKEMAELLAEPVGDRLLNWEIVAALKEHGSRVSLPALARFAARGDQRESEHALEAVKTIVAGIRLLGEAQMSTLGEDELRKLRLGEETDLAVAAVYESHRRGLTTRTSGFLATMAKAPPEARLMSLAVLAGDKWAPAVAELAAVAYESRSDPLVVRVACRAAARVCARDAIDSYRKKPSPGSRVTDQEITSRRRRAAGSLRRLIQDTKIPPASAAAAADALSVVLPRDNDTLKDAALETLVEAIGRKSLRKARAEIGAALRNLSGEDYPNEARFWKRWWNDYRQKQERRRRAERGLID